jgi:hypothetical protein
MSEMLKGISTSVKEFYPSTSSSKFLSRPMILDAGWKGGKYLKPQLTGLNTKPEEWKVDDEIIKKKTTTRFKRGNLFVSFIFHPMPFHRFGFLVWNH